METDSDVSFNVDKKENKRRTSEANVKEGQSHPHGVLLPKTSWFGACGPILLVEALIPVQ